MCGWAMQTKLVSEELRRRGYVCDVLNINENRKVKDPAYIDVQDGTDYVRKVLRYGLRGYSLNVHVNGQSKKGYFLALIATLVGRLTFRPAPLTFHGGLSQAFFPRHDSRGLFWGFKILFQLAGTIACNDASVKNAIAEYGIPPNKISTIASFCPRYLQFTPVSFGNEIENFFQQHRPVFFCYVSFRPEYRLDVLRVAMSTFRQRYPDAGFVWLGFPKKEIPSALGFVDSWTPEERASVLVLGSQTHDEFLTLLSRSYAYIRTPGCDGVASSVLESLAMGIPVVASENGRRPAGTVTYVEEDPEDLCDKLFYIAENYTEVKSRTAVPAADDNVARMSDWLTADNGSNGRHQPKQVE